jgi:hypothetical protein
VGGWTSQYGRALAVGRVDQVAVTAEPVFGRQVVSAIPSARSKYPFLGVFANTLACIMLSKRDKAVLDFERSWWLVPGPKDRAVQEHLGMSAGRYYQILRDLLDDSEAMTYDPLTVRRLLKVRAVRTRRRPEPRVIADGMDPADT